MYRAALALIFQIRWGWICIIKFTRGQGQIWLTISVLLYWLLDSNFEIVKANLLTCLQNCILCCIEKWLLSNIVYCYLLFVSYLVVRVHDVEDY